ncbi:MAG: aminoacetone oxidase family FAD-binding enzyme [Anaerolineae bacterium]
MRDQHDVDILIVGAGAAGLMAGIWAARTAPNRRVLLLDGAAKLGAKILVAGGGRCNVTHDEVTPEAYAGSSRNAIKKVLRRFDVPQTVEFFRALGVPLKREATGKLFPVSDSAKTVLEALLRALREAGGHIQHPRRVEGIYKVADGFTVGGVWGEIRASKVILATGGKSLPKSGSDGGGYLLVRSLGHTLTEHIFPALVPLILPADHFIRTLSGITLPTTLTLWSGTGRKLVSFTDSTLCTHFGLSGPAPLDISRYYTDARYSDADAYLSIHWLPNRNAEQVEADLLALGKVSLLRYLTDHLPERLARALCAEVGVDPSVPSERLTREQRRALVQVICACKLPITGDRGFTYAEVTAGGVPLSEIRLETMESRVCEGLYLCGEICDVDGRIGGYNFQWAWSSGYVAGISAAQ